MTQLFYPENARFTCRQCGMCCQDLRIPLTPRECEGYQKIEWKKIVPDRDSFLELKKSGGSCYLAHRRGEGCVFLQKDGKCLVHSKKGYDFKPLACKIFPLKFIPVGNGVQVGLKFHCPAVLENEGTLLKDQSGEIKRLYNAYRRDQEEKLPEAVHFDQNCFIPWPAFENVERVLLAAMELEGVLLYQKWLFILRLVDQLKKQASGHRKKGEFGIEIDPNSILSEIAQARRVPPSFGEKILLTQLFGYLSEHYRSERSWWSGRIHQISVALGRGKLRLRGFEKEVSFQEIERCKRGDGEESFLFHYFSSKLATRDYFGQATFGFSFVEGISLLALAYPLALILSKICALGHDRDYVVAQDTQDAIYMADFACYASDLLAGPAGKVSRFMLSSRSLVEKLILYYAL